MLRKGMRQGSQVCRKFSAITPSRRMRREGVMAENFLHTWLPWRMPFLNMRSHRKLLVEDGAMALLGGINIGAENVTRFSGPGRIEDVHFQIEGPVARVVM